MIYKFPLRALPKRLRSFRDDLDPLRGAMISFVVGAGFWLSSYVAWMML